MKIVFLDDEKVRHKYMKEILPDIIHVHTADEAIEAIKTGHIDVLFLDHDLADLREQGSLTKNENTGMKVAKWIREDAWIDKSINLIIIHSFNAVGSQNIKNEIDWLRYYKVRIEPFRSMSFIATIGELKRKQNVYNS